MPGANYTGEADRDRKRRGTRGYTVNGAYYASTRLVSCTVLNAVQSTGWAIAPVTVTPTTPLGYEMHQTL